MFSKEVEANLDLKRNEACESLISLVRSVTRCAPQLVHDEATGIPFNAKQFISLQADYTLALLKARQIEGTA